MRERWQVAMNALDDYNQILTAGFVVHIVMTKLDLKTLDGTPKNIFVPTGAGVDWFEQWVLKKVVEPHTCSLRLTEAQRVEFAKVCGASSSRFLFVTCWSRTRRMRAPSGRSRCSAATGR